jgi:prophage maintenance system killer protein
MCEPRRQRNSRAAALWESLSQNHTFIDGDE